MGFPMLICLIQFVSLGRHGKVSCSTANELQQKSDAFSKEEYVRGILTLL